MLQRLDVQLRVLERRNLDPEARQLLVYAPEFGPLTNDVSSQLFGQMPSGPDYLTADIQGAGILINFDWVMQIKADTMIRCVRALCIAINTIIQGLGTAVVLDLVTPVDGADRSLNVVLNEEAQRSRRTRRNQMVLVGLATSTVVALVVVLIERLILGGLF